MNYLTTQLLIQEEIDALIKNLKKENTLWEDGKKNCRRSRLNCKKQFAIK